MKDQVFYKIVRPIISFLVRLVFRPKYIGLENIPDTGKVVLGGNHTSNLDCLLIISSTKRVVHFLAKDSLLLGIKKIVFKNMGIIPVNRSIHDKDALNTAKQYLMDEKLVGIFPEGTINKTEDTVMPFKIGCVKMAYDTDSYIVPFTITGEYKILKNNLIIEFLTPYKIMSDDLTNENKRLMDLVSENLEKRK